MNDTYKKQIEAYIDNEISPEQTQRMRETMQSFPDLEDYAHKLEHQKRILKNGGLAIKVQDIREPEF